MSSEAEITLSIMKAAHKIALSLKEQKKERDDEYLKAQRNAANLQHSLANLQRQLAALKTKHEAAGLMLSEEGNDAHRSASSLQHRVAELQSRVAESRRRSAALKAKCDASGLVLDRFPRFSASIGDDFQCPNCWLEKERRSILNARHDTGTHVRFRCENCDCEIPI